MTAVYRTAEEPGSSPDHADSQMIPILASTWSMIAWTHLSPKSAHHWRWEASDHLTDVSLALAVLEVVVVPVGLVGRLQLLLGLLVLSVQ